MGLLQLGLFMCMCMVAIYIYIYPLEHVNIFYVYVSCVFVYMQYTLYRVRVGSGSLLSYKECFCSNVDPNRNILAWETFNSN